MTTFQEGDGKLTRTGNDWSLTIPGGLRAGNYEIFAEVITLLTGEVQRDSTSTIAVVGSPGEIVVPMQAWIIVSGFAYDTPISQQTPEGNGLWVYGDYGGENSFYPISARITMLSYDEDDARSVTVANSVNGQLWSNTDNNNRLTSGVGFWSFQPNLGPLPPATYIVSMTITDASGESEIVHQTIHV